MPNPETSVINLPDAEIDRTVLALLLTDEGGLAPWSPAEIADAIGDPTVAADAISRLRRSGLLHDLGGGFMFPSRAARHAFGVLDA